MHAEPNSRLDPISPLRFLPGLAQDANKLACFRPVCLHHRKSLRGPSEKAANENTLLLLDPFSFGQVFPSCLLRASSILGTAGVPLFLPKVGMCVQGCSGVFRGVQGCSGGDRYCVHASFRVPSPELAQDDPLSSTRQPHSRTLACVSSELPRVDRTP